jgi:adenosylmethionine-8-amino-7-oxononanoate aminotransferase
MTDIDAAYFKELAGKHFWPHSKPGGDMSRESGVQLVSGAQGVWVRDVDGFDWFDTLSGLWLVNIGHGRREIADAVHRQMLELSFSPHDTVSAPTAQLASRLGELAGDPGLRTYFVSGGSEANETALKLAKHYHRVRGEPGRWKVISRRGSYHGSTLACTSLGRGGNGQSVPVDFGPLVPGNIHVPGPNQHNCHLCAHSDLCTLACAEEIERAIAHEGAHSVAAVIAEPISAAAGIHLPHPDYWPRLRQICDDAGVVLIADEVITGFGRTGRMFATEHWNVQPDLRTVAKGLTSGYYPIGAVMASGLVSEVFAKANATFKHLVTFGGNPPAAAAALANLDIMVNEDMCGRSENMGNYLYERLNTLRSHPIVGDVRGGLGLLCAIQLVANRDTNQAFAADANIEQRATKAMRRHGLLGRAGDVIPVAPPLCISPNEIDEAVIRFDRVLSDLEQELNL